MKKLAVLLVAIVSTSLSPLAFADSKSDIFSSYYYNQETFTFVERGITFSIFENGEFDFYINPRNGIHANVDLGNVSISYNSGYDYDAYVQYDDYGAIVQIEDVPIYYDYYGRISRAGDVRIRYNGQRLARVGGLYLHYNNFGVYSHFTGFVNVYNRNYVFHPYHNYFVRPIFNRCIVSYRPYRRNYNPIRYNYRTYRNNYNRGFRQGYRTAERRAFRDINARVRTKPSKDRRAVDRRSTVANRSNRVAASNNTRRATQQRGTQRTLRSANGTTGTRRATQQRGVQRSTQRGNVQQRNGARRDNGNKVGVRRNNTTRNSSTVAQRRTTSTRAAAERVKTPRRAEQTRTVQRRASSSKVGQRNSRQVRSTQNTRTQTRKAPARKIGQTRTNNTKQYSTQRASSRKNTSVRKQSSRSPQRNVRRLTSSRKRS